MASPVDHLKEHRDVIESDLKLLAARVRPGARVLDIGAGRGAFVSAAASAGYSAAALDMDAGAGAVWTAAGVVGVIASGNGVPFRDGAFDVVRLKEVIEHVEDPLALILEAKRLLAPGGIVIAHTPTPYSQFYPIGNFWDDYTHVRPFSRTALTRLTADAGLRLVSIDAYTSGRNAVERAAGRLLARVLPHIYRLVAERPG
jgi:2-polyprenyl-3-methyl-5-hydroxy-6-metoxy-1,4-benzoquinol methylase